MRYCSTCGTLNDTDAKFCSGCGKPFGNAPADSQNVYSDNEGFVQPEPQAYSAPEEEPQAVYTYQQPTAAYAQPQPVQTIRPKARVFGIISLVFGIITVAFAWVGIIPIFGQIFGIIFLAMAIVGLVFAKKSSQMSNFRLAKPGKILCIIGLIFVIICFLIGLAVLIYGIASGEFEDILDSIYYNRYFY